jgi:quinol monooxygenase YgiN
MTFKDDKTEDFLAIFNKYKKQIRNQPGCVHLELLQDHHNSNIFSTYSHWHDEVSLNKYRQSETFGKIWPATKVLFGEAVTAHSYEVKQHVNL